MPEDSKPRRLLTLPQVAQRLDQHVDTIRRKIRRREIPAVQLGGRGCPIRVDERELATWLYEVQA